jgi:hypothetical protein
MSSRIQFNGSLTQFSFLLQFSISINCKYGLTLIQNIMMTKLKPEPVNKAKICEARIDQPRGQPNVKFIISSNGTVMIYIINSEHPFPLSTDQDVSDILLYFLVECKRIYVLFSLILVALLFRL